MAMESSTQTEICQKKKSNSFTKQSTYVDFQNFGSKKINENSM